MTPRLDVWRKLITDVEEQLEVLTKQVEDLAPKHGPEVLARSRCACSSPNSATGPASRTANRSVVTPDSAVAYYAAKRKDGMSHACALRCLAQRWLKSLWKMWQTHMPYDPDYHARNQQKHGS